MRALAYPQFHLATSLSFLPPAFIMFFFLCRGRHTIWPRDWSSDVCSSDLPVARWNETGLFSDRGEVFQVSGSESMQGLARLGGPEARSEEVLRRWQKLRRRLDSIGRQVVAVMLDERGAWTVDLDDGVQLILGREQVDRRVERYLRSQASLQELGQAIRFVDLRYTNGLAVGFAENGTDERSRTELDEDIERG